MVQNRMTKRQMTSSNGIRISSNAETNFYLGGGNKKAGLVPLKTAPAMRWIALDVAQTRNTLPNLTNAKGQVIFGLQKTLNPHKALKPISSTLTPNPYWTIPGTN